MNRKDAYTAQAQRGSVEDIRFLMNQLDHDHDLTTIKLVDMVIDYIEVDTGIDEMKRYLFHGTSMQRNYAANFFRRRGERELLLEAWEEHAIDNIQAFAR